LKAVVVAVPQAADHAGIGDLLGAFIAAVTGSLLRASRPHIVNVGGWSAAIHGLYRVYQLEAIRTGGQCRIRGQDLEEVLDCSSRQGMWRTQPPEREWCVAHDNGELL
jgi:hypothetical protein